MWDSRLPRVRSSCRWPFEFEFSHVTPIRAYIIYACVCVYYSYGRGPGAPAPLPCIPRASGEFPSPGTGTLECECMQAESEVTLVSSCDLRCIYYVVVSVSLQIANSIIKAKGFDCSSVPSIHVSDGVLSCRVRSSCLWFFSMSCISVPDFRCFAAPSLSYSSYLY